MKQNWNCKAKASKASLAVSLLVVFCFILLTAAPGAALGMKTIKNIPYAFYPGVKLNLTSLNIYAPDDAGPAKKYPVMIYVHGGGWAKGDKNQVDVKPQAYTSRGYVLVSTNYRLTTSKIKFPIHARDVAKAISWVYGHGSLYGADSRKIFLMGHSAGCHLVAIVATDPTYLTAQGLTLKNIKGVIDLDTQAYDLPHLAEGYGGWLPEVYAYTFGYNPVKWAASSPITYVKPGRGIPPQIIAYSGGIQGVEDRLRKEQSEAFYQALIKAHITTELVPAPTKTHSQINQEFGIPGDPVTEACFAFLSRILKGIK